MSYLLETLERLLSVKRPADGSGEATTAAWIVSKAAPTMIDSAGNLHFKIGESATMFTAHLDTVHHDDGPNPFVKMGDMWAAAGDSVLGADCGAGVALILHMISQAKPGYYVLFRGEECGGVGSTWLSKAMPEIVTNIKRCVSLDRAGYSDVITHQGGRQGCSSEFAEALSDALNDNGMLFMPCPNGVYTDSKEFFSLIPECTNLSVGYRRQHTPEETQNVAFLAQLADALVAVDWESLPTVRKPTIPVPVARFHEALSWLSGGFPDEDPVGDSMANEIEEALSFEDPEQMQACVVEFGAREVADYLIDNYTFACAEHPVDKDSRNILAILEEGSATKLAKQFERDDLWVSYVLLEDSVWTPRKQPAIQGA